jgi:hypothetical protein
MLPPLLLTEDKQGARRCASPGFMRVTSLTRPRLFEGQGYRHQWFALKLVAAKYQSDSSADSGLLRGAPK